MTTKWIKKRRSRVIRTVVFVIALAVFLISAWQLLSIFLEYKRGSDEYDSLASQAEQLLETAQAEEENPGENQAEENPSTGPWTQFHSTMLAQNEDYVGWIIIEDTKINYPIVQFSDNSWYLNHTFEGQENSSGALFEDCGIPEKMEGKNVIVYGHNMKNGSMFANLKKFREDDFYESHKTFQVYTETGFYTYEIFAVCVVSPDSDAYTLSFADDAAFLSYVEQMQAQSIMDTGVQVQAEDRIITLSTCVNNNRDRLIVQARRLES